VAIRTASFLEVLNAAMRRQGQNPDTVPAHTQEAYAGYMTERAREAWRSYDWPSARVLEQRDVTVDPAQGNFIPLDEAGKTPIGVVLSVWRENPLVTCNPCEVRWKISQNGVQFHPGTDAPTSVWIEYTLPAPKFTVTEWSAVPTYFPGDVVYVAARKECFRAIAVNTDAAPPAVDDSDANWTRQFLIEEIARFLQRAVCADAWAEEGQTANKDEELSAAYQALQDEQYDIEARQGGYRERSVSIRRRR
jgi:hypothetical protein